MKLYSIYIIFKIIMKDSFNFLLFFYKIQRASNLIISEMRKQFLTVLNLFKLLLLAQSLLFTQCSEIADLFEALTTLIDLFSLLLILKNLSIVF